MLSTTAVTPAQQNAQVLLSLPATRQLHILYSPIWNTSKHFCEGLDNLPVTSSCPNVSYNILADLLHTAAIIRWVGFFYVGFKASCREYNFQLDWLNKMFRADQVHNNISISEKCVQFKRKQAAELVVIYFTFHSFWKSNPQTNYSSQSMQEFGTSFWSELSIHMSLSGQHCIGRSSEAFTLQLFSPTLFQHFLDFSKTDISTPHLYVRDKLQGTGHISY